MENLDMPIPGENFLSDTRNQSWHRPPEYDHPDQFLKYVDRTFKKPQKSQQKKTYSTLQN